MREYSAEVNGYRAKVVPPTLPGARATLMIGPSVFEITEDEIDGLVHILTRAKEAAHEARKRSRSVGSPALATP